MVPFAMEVKLNFFGLCLLLIFILLLEWPINKVQIFQNILIPSQKPLSYPKTKSICVPMSGAQKLFLRIPLNQEDTQLSIIKIFGILVQIQKFQMRRCGSQCQKFTFCPPSENTLHRPIQRRMKIISKCKFLNSQYNFLPKSSCIFICQEKALAGDLFILLINMS